MPESLSKTVLCPQCGAECRFEPANPFRPFCSERCRMIDLGAWASESYRVPLGEEPDPGGSLPPGDA
jgi:endogenous inhibitor of DNA gyrase (YacG/DUF329 family)